MHVSNTITKKKYYTIAAIKDELTRTLSSTADYNINQQSNHIEIDYKYYRYAQKLLYLTNIAKEIPIFEIKYSDISMELQNELERLDEETLDEVIVDSICRLYESVNFKYFYESGVKGKIKWRILPN